MSTASWRGNTLVLSSDATYPNGNKRNVVRAWTLDADNQLQIEITMGSVRRKRRTQSRLQEKAVGVTGVSGGSRPEPGQVRTHGLLRRRHQGRRQPRVDPGDQRLHGCAAVVHRGENLTDRGRRGARRTRRAASADPPQRDRGLEAGAQDRARGFSRETPGISQVAAAARRDDDRAADAARSPQYNSRVRSSKKQ